MKYRYADFLKYPLWISWEVTNLCNYRCVHCRMDDEDLENDSELDFKECRTFIDEIADLEIGQINFSGGEPFLREDFIEILNYTAAKGIRIGITTNGSLLDKSKIDQIAKIPTIDFIQVSIDGPNSEIHEHIRGVPGAFEKAVVALKQLKKTDLRIGAVTTVMRTNINEIPNIVELLNKMEINVYGARRFIPVGHGKKAVKDLLITPDEYKSHCQRWIKYINEDQQNMDFFIEEPLLAIFKEQLPSYWKTPGCMAGTIYGALTANGDILSCIFLPQVLGNVRNDSFSDIWNHSSIRQKIINRELTGDCGTCSKVDDCGGCRAMAMFNDGDVFGDDPTCFLTLTNE